MFLLKEVIAYDFSYDWFMVVVFVNPLLTSFPNSCNFIGKRAHKTMQIILQLIKNF